MNRTSILTVGSLALVVGIVGLANFRVAGDAPVQAPPLAGLPGAPSTSRDGLGAVVRTMEARLHALPADIGAAVALADALIRLQRVQSDGALAVRAERVLRAALAHDPDDYEARRMLAASLLSQHRFREALREAERLARQRPHDAWNHGAIGDAHLELGDYDRAFDAFDRMVTLRPNASSYARVAYARELRGDINGALQAMRMALEATSAHDPESQAWHRAQIGHLLLLGGRVDEASREFDHSAHLFPRHPYALMGQARVRLARHDQTGALAILSAAMHDGPTPELAAQIGDLHAALGDPAGAETMYVQAEAMERAGWEREEPQPGALARFLAQRNRAIDEAVRLAERAAATRDDIHTNHALALAYFRAGRLTEAQVAIARATRLGTRDPEILATAEAIGRAPARAS